MMYRITATVIDGRQIVYDTTEDESKAEQLFGVLVAKDSPCTVYGPTTVVMEELYKGYWIKTKQHVVIP